MELFELPKGSIQVAERDGKRYVYWVYHDHGPHWKSLGRLEEVTELLDESKEPLLARLLGGIAVAVLAVVGVVVLFSLFSWSSKGKVA